MNQKISPDSPQRSAPVAAEANWDMIIQPVSGWFDIHLSELWRYRDLIMLFVRRDFVAVYKQTILGPLWYLIQPLMTTLVFTVIFGKVAKIPTDGLPQVLFYLSGVVAWRYFADCLTKTSNTFVGNAGIFGKVYFPRLTVPLAVVISNLISFAIQFALFLGFVAYYYLQGAAIHPQPLLFAFPLLILQMAALGLGFGIIVSSLTTKYRDLAQLVGFGVQLWMYATPIVYPTSQIPEKYQWIMALNPMAPVIEAFRYAFLGSGTVSFSSLAISGVTTLVVLAIGIILFSRIEKSFMDTV
ncbi:MAG: ABC transporter permease [Desulfobacterales bacterium]|nr:ABC transporter permease [Desulfobacterales bacterium]